VQKFLYNKNPAGPAGLRGSRTQVFAAWRSVLSRAQSGRPAAVAVMVVMRVVEDSDHVSNSVLETGSCGQGPVNHGDMVMRRSLTARRHVRHAGGMRLRRWRFLFVMVLTTVAACRQADGDQPQKTGDVPQRLVDLGRDLEGVAGGDQQAVKDLTDDLLVFVDEPHGKEVTQAMSAAVCPMLVKRNLTADAETRLATVLWKTVAARDLSERQIDGLKEEMRDLLISLGVQQQDANYAAGWVGTVQKAVAIRSRRWYERY
jgi:hypothetical protein